MKKSFLIKCHCGWKMLSTGTKEDLKDLSEVKNACQNCGRPRRFKCPKCGQVAVMRRILGNT